METIKRIIGEYGTGKEGPLLFVTAGIHGNEPSGIYALRRVFEILEEEKPDIKGKIVGVSGNMEALKKGVRYIDEDLNRTWTEENVDSGKKDSHEKKEMFDIISVLENVSKESFSKRYFLDCHTTSAASEPYISVQEVNDNDEWAHHFPVYIIRGFSDIVKGCIDHYESRIGVTGFVFEGGHHESTEAIAHHEGMIWLALRNAGMLDLSSLNKYPEAAKFLEEKRNHRKTFEIEYRHGLEEGDDFKMQEGFVNFQAVKKGEYLALHNGKKVHSEWDAFIFMPLYQKQGNDGFFIVKEVAQ
ncbi:MAG TPA: succinylglutamate desuccinylase/aspartoacylase family protein [Flavobacteriaceae bacterium]|nr:succinylglutamate desuccinylase/aspartoacylase family protein [Flavobacteriaceae bacterium]